MKKRNLHLWGALLLAFQISNVRASIVYTNIPDVTLTTGGTLDINFDNAGVPEFTFNDFGSSGMIMPSINFNNGFSMVTVSSNEFDNLRGLPANATITAFTSFFSQGNAFIDPSWGMTLFPSGMDTYLGAKFALSTGTHLGWIRVNWNSQTTTFTVKDYAYENVPNVGISMGATGVATGIDEATAADIFQMGPNPASDYLKIKNLKAQDLQLKIVNITGAAVYEQHVEASATIDLREFPAGIYFVTVSGREGKLLAQRLIKQ